MNLPKFSPSQWLRIVLAVLPHARVLLRSAGLGVVELIRLLIDLIARVEALFPPEIGSDGVRLRRGKEKAEALRALVLSAFAKADEALDQAPVLIEAIDAIAAQVVSLFNLWGVFSSKERANA